MEELLKISGLNLYLRGRNHEKKILDNLNFEVFPAEIVAVVGESGCGKTMLARSILKLNSERIFRTEGKILYEDKDITELSNNQMLEIRGGSIGIVFQEPASFLNPTMKMGTQISESLIRHLKLNSSRAMDTIEMILGLLGIKNVQNYVKQYPHQLSGGLAQRGMIAAATSCKPRLLIADEPTSALDVISQAEIVKLIRDLSREFGMSVIFITHDMELARLIADRAVIMCNGAIVESGDINNVFKMPQHEATKRLIEGVLANPIQENQINLIDCAGKLNKNVPLMEIKNLNKSFRNKSGGLLNAVNNISLSVFKGEVLGILGESGCGKSTLTKLLAGIINPDRGEILVEGSRIDKIRDYPKHVQIVFQDPISSMDPRMKIEDIIAEGLDVNKLCKRKERKLLVLSYLEKVGLDSTFLYRFPHELSGGQRQRINIARALIMKPDMLIFDEPTSYLDTVSQLLILELFSKMKEEMDLTYVFVTHNLKVLGKICDRIAVMMEGRIVEIGNTREILNSPTHPYTQMFSEFLKGRH